MHPKYKTQYRVGNWAEYDRALVRRGDVTLWLTPDAIATWAAAGVGRRWAEQANRALARAGCPEQIHAGSLAQQLTEAEHRGDADAIARLAHREPGVHLGPHNVARAERGEPLERTAEAVSVADRNQALAADRADVSRMEQALHHLRDEITKAVKALGAAPPGAACAGA